MSEHGYIWEYWNIPRPFRRRNHGPRIKKVRHTTKPLRGVSRTEKHTPGVPETIAGVPGPEGAFDYRQVPMTMDDTRIWRSVSTKTKLARRIR